MASENPRGAAARLIRRAASDIMGGLDEAYRIFGPVGFVSVGLVFVFALVVLARA